ncbi:MAG TPA: GNAT family N-acetyltransferase [Acidimicrobiales bacterium]|jgi:GNAT superfamily N-acetyltransferase|nr:GNAT family N-acetyltransferase [Acidimicrobiales bacterium]
MPIRPAAPTDIPEIHALIRGLAEHEHLTDQVRLDEATLHDHLFGDEPAARVTIAEEPDGVVVGFALWFPTYSSFLGRPGIWLEDLFVRPAYRGRGYGSALIRDLRARTAGRVEWAVLDWNEPAIEFYESLGARAVAGWTTYRWLPDRAG